jgi:hypothetical protein
VSASAQVFQRFVGRCRRRDVVPFRSQRERQHQPYIWIVFEQQDANGPERAGIAALDVRRLRSDGAHTSNYDAPTSAG